MSRFTKQLNELHFLRDWVVTKTELIHRGFYYFLSYLLTYLRERKGEISNILTLFAFPLPYKMGKCELAKYGEWKHVFFTKRTMCRIKVFRLT